VAETALIAIVDDDHLMRRSLARLLRSAGFRAESFSSAEDYLDSGNHERTSCIIPDIGLPGMSGFGLERHLAAIDHRLPVVFVSARDTRPHKEGAIAFLGKLFDDNRCSMLFTEPLGQRKEKRSHIFVLCLWIRQMQ
jgi:FixJ family two-component response regulator